MRSILSNMFPTYDKFFFHYAKIFNTQVYTNDCGLFVLSYAAALGLKYNEFIDDDLREYKVPIISKNSFTHFRPVIHIR